MSALKKFLDTEALTLGIFLAALITCVVIGASVIYALLVGLACFSGYAIKKGNTVRATIQMLMEGIKGAWPVITVVLIIGMLTASWRACGTIAYILQYAAGHIDPSYFALFTFLICAMMSILTGTSFGTAGTAGVVCMSIAQYLGLSPLITGGAIMSGIFVGDRCSPMSSSALLVANITQTDIWVNIKIMWKTSLVPLLLCITFYGVVGLMNKASLPASPQPIDFWSQFHLSPWLFVPAALIIVMCLLRIKLHITMGTSILSAVIICFVLQGISAKKMVHILIFGYNDGAGNLMNGGGIVSMLSVLVIIVISSSYFDIFHHTPLLSGVKKLVLRAAARVSAFVVTVILSVMISAVSCNQTLATMLTCEMQREIVGEPLKQAEYLENSVILIAALIPWSIAGAVPLAMIKAPMAALLFAVYLYLVPLWNIVVKR